MFNLAISEQRVIDLLWRHGALSRGRLAEMTGLTVPTLSRICQSLIGQGLTRETDLIREGRRGQPTHLLDVNPSAAYAMGIGVTPSELSLCLVDLQGNMVGEQRRKLADCSPEIVTGLLDNEVSKLFEGTGVDRTKVLGAGIVIPGQYLSATRMTSIIPEMSTWIDIDFSKNFAPMLGMPVWCNNYAKAAALMEARFGSARDRDFVCYVNLSYGIGGGLVLHQKILNGQKGNGGSFGALFPRDAPRPSALDLMMHLRAAGITATSVEAMADIAVPPEILAPWLARAAEQLSWLIYIIGWTIAPDVIVVGGLIPTPILEQLVSLVRPSSLMVEIDGAQPLPALRLAAHNGKGSARGAATLAFQRIMPASNDDESNE